MLKNRHLKEWSKLVSARMPNLSIPQVMGLATWSFGIAMTRSTSLTQIAELIGQIEAEPANTVRQRLKEWYQEAKAKKGEHRQSLEVKNCFAPLLEWVLDLLPVEQRQIALAMDATSIGDRFVVLSINILLAGSGIPVAWAIVKGNTKGSWKPHWQSLIEQLHSAIPKDYQVIVAADRGLYADWLYQAITAVGWHPLLRINHQGLFHLPGSLQWLPLDQLIKVAGQPWSGFVTCFKTNPLDCTLLARWAAGYQDPWLILTDLPPNQADALWYGLRSTTECVYRDIKSDGWKWQHTRLIDPARAERVWLAIAVATLWMLFLGGTADSSPVAVTNSTSTVSASSLPPIPRQLSCFLRGLLTLLSDFLRDLPIHLCPWTTFPSTPVDSFYALNSSYCK